MNRLVLVLAAGLLSPTLAVALPSASSTLFEPATPGSTTQFQVNERTQIPGHQLKPGSYSLTIVDRLTDRMVVRVNNSTGKEEATFIGLPGGGRLQKQSSEGPITMSAKGGPKSALRGFSFSDGSTVEFVYPKDEAVALAKANNATVPAVDPASEGRVASPDLSKTDMQLVTLWMLTPTLVGSNQPGIEAKRYQETAEASNTTPAEPARSQPARSESARQSPRPQPAYSPAPAPNVVASNNPPAPPAAPRPRPVAHPIATLPHTASDLPLTAMAGLGSFALAGFLGLRRRLATARR